MHASDDHHVRGITATAQALTRVDDLAAVYGKNIDAMSRDELLALLRELAPQIGEARRLAQELEGLVRDLHARDVAQSAVPRAPI